MTCKSSGKGGSSIYLKGPPAGISTHRLDLALAMKVSTDVIYLEVEFLTPVHNLALCGSSWSPLHANDNPELVTLASEAGAKTVIGITIDRRRGTFSTSGSISSDGTGTVNGSILFSPVIPLVVSLLPGQACCIGVGLSPFKLQPPPGSRSFFDVLHEAVLGTSNFRAAAALASAELPLPTACCG